MITQAEVIALCVGFVSAVLPATAIAYMVLSAVVRQGDARANEIDAGNKRELERKQNP